MSRSRRWAVMAVLAIVVAASLVSMAERSSAEVEPWQLPRWEAGFTWSYVIDEDMDYDLFGYIHVDHIRDNLTRTVYKELTVGNETHYQVWDEHRGTLQGSVSYGIFNFDITAQMIGSGWTYIRASDLAIINQTQNMTFSADDIPIIGSFTGGMDNRTDYDPPVPLLRFPVTETSWDVHTTATHTTEFFLLYPEQTSTWINETEEWNLTVTTTGPADHTVPLGTFPAFSANEVGTITNSTCTRPVDRTWYYGNEAANVLETWDGYQLVYTDAQYIPPNSPPVGPVDTVLLETPEDTPLDIDLGTYFTDPDGDALTYGLKLLGLNEVNATLEGSGSSWTLTPATNWSGALDLSASARDPSQSEATGAIRVNVTPVNDPPHVADAPFDLVTDEDVPILAAFDLDDVFDDVDGDELVYLVEASEGVHAMLNGTALDLVPVADWTGFARIDLAASDPSGARANTSFTLMVGSVNDPPSIVSSGGPARIHEAENGTFWVEVFDADSEVLGYTWYLEGVPVAGVEGPDFVYAPGDLTVDSVTIAVKVVDEWDDGDVLEWTVGIMDAPWITSATPASPLSRSVADTVTFTVEVQDADTPDPSHKWYWKDLLVGTQSDLDLTLGVADAGEGKVRVEVSDGVGAAVHEWDLTVTIPNEPPEVTMTSPIDGSKGKVGEAITLSVTVYDEDPGNLTVRWFVDGSPVATGTDGSYTPSREGSLVIQVTVSDGEHDVTRSIDVDVRASDDPSNGDGISDDNTLLILILAVALMVGVLLVVIRASRKRDGPENPH